jgi:hypothetical protein
LKVTYYATPDEKKIFEEGQELSKKIEIHITHIDLTKKP